MQLFSLLDPVIPFLGETYDVALNGLGKLIKGLIDGIGIVGVGIILFSIILKLVVLPFDIYQRVTMRKQNIKMKENQARLEKLQKQYANDKAMYNQKMMELYKESGISMFSSCLPMIISMVVFIVAINAFNAFSYYSNLQSYNKMVESYNGYLSSYTTNVDEATAEQVEIVKDASGNPSFVRVYNNAENVFIYCEIPYAEKAAEDTVAYVKGVKDKQKTYKIDVEKVYLNATFNADIEALMNAYNAKHPDAPYTKEDACREYFESNAQKQVAKVYRAEIKDETGFLWIKNIWKTDASYEHPVSSYKKFKDGISSGKIEVPGKNVKFGKINNYTNAYTKDNYNVVTAELKEEKNEPNGYFILIALSIGTILLQQFISMRSQKEQNKFSSVDGQGAANQKMMLIVMTVMFGIFSFMYSSAFSIYMIMSNVLSLIMTLVINKIVDVVFEKREAAALQAKYDKRFPNRRQSTEDKNKKK